MISPVAVQVILVYMPKMVDTCDLTLMLTITCVPLRFALRYMSATALLRIARRDSPPMPRT